MAMTKFPDGASPSTPINVRAIARRTLELERDAVDALIQRLDEAFERACTLILACQGRVVVTGMGKSGHIGGKIAATLASTGTRRSLFIPVKPAMATLA